MGNRFTAPKGSVPATSYEQYCAFMDKAMEAFANPITNSYLSAVEARRAIDERRMFLAQGNRAACVLLAQPGMYQCLYVADGDGEPWLLRQSPDAPVVIDEICANNAPLSPEKAALLDRNGFRFLRKTLRLVRRLEAPEEGADLTDVELAKRADIPALYALLEENFDPCADRFPAEDELAELICQGYVHVIRSGERIAAANISLPQGRMVHHHWLAVGRAHRNNAFLVVRICEQRERDAYRHGHMSAMIWVDAENDKLLKCSEYIGYRLDGRVMYTYTLHKGT